MYKRRAHVLFLSRRNACRSQMAEAWGRHLGGTWLEARSAGIAPQRIDPRAVATMHEVGIDVGMQRSRPVTSALLHWADLVVTFEANVLAQWTLHPGTRQKHWPLADPCALNGEDVAGAFAAARDELRSRVASMVGGMRMLARSDEHGEEE